MGLITKSVKMNPSGKSILYYKNKGYDVQWHKEIEIQVNDLPDNSNVIVEVQCDYEECKCIESIHYSKYTKNIKQNNGLFYCKNCWHKRLPQTLMNLYGVDNISKLEEIKEKKCQTMHKNYGVYYVLQSSEIRERSLNTCEKKYGTRNVAELDSIKEKRKSTLIQRYGVENAMQCTEIYERAKKTNLSRYGFKYCSQVPEIKQKVALTLSKNQSVSTSKQQRYIHNLYNGELNGVVSHYNCDIVFREEKMIVEYDGGGHLLTVELGELSQAEFNQKELIRDKLIKSEGYRIMRIISRKDYLPSDTTLLNMLQYARDFFTSNSKRSWISFDIDNKVIYNAYHKESELGLPYNYGKLRKIKNINLEQNNLKNNRKEEKTYAWDPSQKHKSRQSQYIS